MDINKWHEIKQRLIQENGCLDDVVIDGHEGMLMTWDEFFIDVNINTLTDHDGSGDLVNEKGVIIGRINPSDVYVDGWNPEWIDKNKEDVFVLWYNK